MEKFRKPTVLYTYLTFEYISQSSLIFVYAGFLCL